MKRGQIKIAIVALSLPCFLYAVASFSTYENIRPESPFNGRYELLDASQEETDAGLVPMSLLRVLIEPPNAVSPDHCDDSCTSDADCACDEACMSAACPGIRNSAHQVCTPVQSAGSACCDVQKTCEDGICISFDPMPIVKGVFVLSVSSKKAIGNGVTYKMCSVVGNKCQNDKQQDCGVIEYYAFPDCGDTPSNPVVSTASYTMPACETTPPPQ